MGDVIDVIISETCGAVLACDPDDAPRKVVSYARFRQLERSVATQATLLPSEANIGTRYCAKCFGLLVDASGHVLNEHAQGCKGDDWPVVSRRTVLTNSIDTSLPEHVAGLIEEARKSVRCICDETDAMFLKDYPKPDRMPTGHHYDCPSQGAVSELVIRLIAALETQGRERFNAELETSKWALEVSEAVLGHHTRDRGKILDAIVEMHRERAVLTAEVAAREERRATILEWLEDQIGTDWECTCGHSEYNTMPFCQQCGLPASLLHCVAFKLHATHNEPATLSQERAQTQERITNLEWHFNESEQYVEVAETRIADLERERAVLAEGLKAVYEARKDTAFWHDVAEAELDEDFLPGYAEAISATRKALVLIEGEKD